MTKIKNISLYLLGIISLFVFFAPIITNAASTDHFVIEVTITDGGDTTFTIPTYPGETYSYDVDWDNDQTFEDTGNTGDATHDFTTTGTYTVRITGTFPRIYFNNTGDKLKITDILQWGTNTWTSMEKAFYGCSNLDVSATDTPDLSGVTDMSYMFYNADAVSADLSSWDTSTITNFSYTFYDADGLQTRLSTLASEVEYTAPDQAQATNTGDLNNDGYPDFIVNGADGWRVYLNDGDGTFTVGALNTEKALAVRDTEIADVDQDGNLDFVLPDYNGYFHIFYGNGDGTFGSATTHTGIGNNLGVAVGDLDGDGDNDIATAYWSGGTIAVFLNNGDNKFSQAVQYSLSAIGPRIISIGDLNGDGYNDMVATVDGAAGAHVLLNNGDGTFANYVLYTNAGWGGFSIGNDIADLDLDGDLDIAVASHGNCQYMGTLINNGDGTFVSGSNIDMSCSGINNVELGDINGDGYPDAVGGNVNWNNISVFINNGSGGFSSYTNYSVGGDPQTIALADFNQDGGIDVVAPDADNDKASVFLTNNSGIIDWNTSSATNMSYMFSNATFNQGLSSWNVSSVTNMTSMFQDNTIFDQDLSDWNVRNVTNMTNMFDGATLSTDNYDFLLEAWSLLNLQSSVTFNGGNSTYCYGESERQSIVNTYGWTITDGGYDCTDATTRITISLGGTSNNFTTSKKPPVPSFNIQEVDNNTVNIIGSYSPNNIVVDKLAIEYTNNNTNKTKEYEISSKIAYKSNFAFKNLLDLEEDTSYTFKIYAENKQGKVYGNTIDLTLGNPDNNTNTTTDNNIDDTTVDEETEELIKQLQAQIESLMQQIIEILLQKISGYTNN